MERIKSIGRDWFRRIDEAKVFWQNLFNRKLTRSFTSRRSLRRTLISSSPIWATSSGRTSTRTSPSIKAGNVLPIDIKPRKASNKPTLNYADGGSNPPTSTLVPVRDNSSVERKFEMEFPKSNEVDVYNIEVALLGTVLIHGNTMYTVFPAVTADMFSSMGNRYIYMSMQEEHKKGNAPNHMFVYNTLQKHGWEDTAGGESYLHSVAQGARPQEDVKELISIIQSQYKVRRLKEINAAIPSMLNGSGNVNEVISKLHQDLDKLARDIGTPDVTRVSDTIDDVIDDVKSRTKNPGPRGLSTGISDVDFQTGGLVEGDVWYIGARPSHGKSAWLTKTLMNVAQDGEGVMMFNREMSAGDIQERMLAIASGVSLQKMRSGMVDKVEQTKLDNCRDKIYDLPFYIDNNFIGGIEYIVSTIRKYHQLYNVRVIGIDYIQLIVERTTESVHLLGNASRQLKLLANELGITVIILSQMNRNVEQREDRRPLMADLRQSGNMEEDADIMVALYRDEVYDMNSPAEGVMEFIVRKSRNGPIGVAILDFDGETVNIKGKGTDKLWRGEGFIQ